MPITQPPPFLFMQNTLCTLRAQRPKSEGLLVPSAAERDVPPTQQDEHPHRRHNFLRTRKKMNPMRYAPVVHFLWRHAVAPPAAARCPRHARPLVALLLLVEPHHDSYFAFVPLQSPCGNPQRGCLMNGATRAKNSAAMSWAT
mmetsp:Transcript_32449/g.79008  ORF Transcript_32449/g.79008 Transcript_32449/m.79008 type:complete len:143 (-) Transcript_32449:572-1000(-)